MPKKATPEIVHKEGWNWAGDIAARCANCGYYLSIGVKKYWRFNKEGRTEIRCVECCDL